MKTPAEIHAEVGTEIRPGTASLLADSGCRAFTVSDIEKIIADAKAESHSEIATLRKNHSDTMRVIKEVQMKTADLMTNFTSQTFDSTTEAHQWLRRNVQQVEDDARISALEEAAEVCRNRETGSDFTVEATRCKQAILSLATKLKEGRESRRLLH